MSSDNTELYNELVNDLNHLRRAEKELKAKYKSDMTALRDQLIGAKNLLVTVCPHETRYPFVCGGIACEECTVCGSIFGGPRSPYFDGR